MKSYKDRLPEIDKAIFELGGDWKVGDCIYRSWSGVIVFRDADQIVDPSFIPISTRAEFKSRLADWRRLYEWRLQKGGIPKKLTLSEWLSKGRYRDAAPKIAEDTGFNWQELLEEDMEESNWYERGEKPPAGTCCEVKFEGSFIKCFVVGLDEDGEGLVCKVERKTERGSKVEYIPHYSSTFRPIKSKRENLIELATDVLVKMKWNDDLEESAEALYDAGMLKLPEEE